MEVPRVTNGQEYFSVEHDTRDAMSGECSSEEWEEEKEVSLVGVATVWANEVLLWFYFR